MDTRKIHNTIPFPFLSIISPTNLLSHTQISFPSLLWYIHSSASRSNSPALYFFLVGPLTALISWYLVKFFGLACPTTNINVHMTFILFLQLSIFPLANSLFPTQKLGFFLAKHHIIFHFSSTSKSRNTLAFSYSPVHSFFTPGFVPSHFWIVLCVAPNLSFL